MKVHLALDIADVMAAIEDYVAKRYPDIELDGVTVKTWNATVFEVSDGKIQAPWFHRVCPERRTITG